MQLFGAHSYLHGQIAHDEKCIIIASHQIKILSVSR